MEAVTIMANSPIDGQCITTVLGTDMAFKDMAKFIGSPGAPAMLERVEFNWGEMWVDEEGLLKANPTPNATATRVASPSGHRIYGNAVLRIKKGYAYNVTRGCVERLPKAKKSA